MCMAVLVLVVLTLLCVRCSPVPIILGVIGTIVVMFVVVNVVLWYYAQQVRLQAKR